MNDAAALQEENKLLREKLAAEKDKLNACDAQISGPQEQIKQLLQKTLRQFQ